MKSVALLILRLTVGGLLAGHGAQKLFGWGGGAGLEGTTGWLESLRLRPAKAWAHAAGWSEFGGGVLTALGFLNPIGPLAAMGSMLMATTKVHLGKPIWVTTGGAELPVTNAAALTALAIAGPGAISVDSLLGVRLPRRLGILGALAVVGVVAYAGQQELAAGTSEIAATGGEQPGDPSTEQADQPVAGTAPSVTPDQAVTTLADMDDGGDGARGDLEGMTVAAGERPAL
ncbi:MAG: DoxX family protein [Chloroflexota bacterium]|jgi:putative oxidoreductase